MRPRAPGRPPGGAGAIDSANIIDVIDNGTNSNPRSEDNVSNNKQVKAQIRARRARFNAAVTQDMQRRSVGDGDIDFANTGREMHWNDDRTAVTGWTMAVALHSGELLLYTMDNADAAPLLCNGKLVLED